METGTALGSLLAQSPPYPDESGLGYITRLVENNRYWKTSFLLDLIRPRERLVKPITYFIPTSLIDPSALVRATGLYKSKVNELLDLPISESVDGHSMEWTFFGQPIRSLYLRANVSRVCPACLMEKPVYMRRIWELNAMTVCIRHGCLLLDRCPSCNKLIPAIRLRTCLCPCGYDFRNAPIISVKQEEALPASRIFELCGFSALCESLPRFEPSNPLLKLNLEQYLDALFVVGRHFWATENTHIKSFPYSLATKDIHALLQRIASVYFEWPRNFFRFLNDLRQRPAGGPDTGLRRDFNPFFRYLFDEKSDSRLDFLRKDFGEYLKDWDGGYAFPRSRPVREGWVDRCKWIPERLVTKTLKISSPLLRRRIKTGLIKGSIRKRGGRVMCLVQLESIEQYASAEKFVVSLMATAKLLGISRHVVVDLVEHDCLRPICGRLIDGSLRYVFRVEAIEALLDGIRKQIPPCRRGKHDLANEVSFTCAQRSLSSIGLGVSTLVQAIVEGRIKPIGLGGEAGLQSFWFDKKVLLKYIEKQRYLIKNGATVKYAARILGVKQEVLVQFVKNGFLAAPIDDKTKRIRSLSESAITEFSNEYVLGARMAAKFRTSPGYFVRKLQNEGIFAVAGPSIDGSRQYLFRRKDVEGVDIENIFKKKNARTGSVKECTLSMGADHTENVYVKEG